MDKYFENLIEAAVKKTVKKKKKKRDVEEIVNDDGSIIGSKIPVNKDVATTTAKGTTDNTVDMARQPPMTGFQSGAGGITKRYWGESDMSDALGYEETLGKDKSYDEAKKYFMDELGFDEVETEERLAAMGYQKEKENKVRLIENPLNLIEQIIDDVINNPEPEPQETLNPIIRRQLQSLKQTMMANNLTIKDIIEYLK